VVLPFGPPLTRHYFVLVLPPPTRPRILQLFEEEARERGRNNGASAGNTTRLRVVRPEVEYFQRGELLGSSRLGALLSPEETLKELDMGARGRLQGEVRT
jgi:hypothetical protein